MKMHTNSNSNNSNKQAPRGEIVFTRYVSEPKKMPKNAFAALGELTALPQTT